MLEALETLRQKLPDFAKDLKLNLQSVLTDSSLSAEQRWGVALAAALVSGSAPLRDAILADAARVAPPGVIDDARAAAALLSMNNVFYRSRHMFGKAAYETKPPRLRMNRIGQVASSKLNFELFSIAVSAVNGCEVCLKAHEKTVTEQGASEDQVYDTIRIAAVIQGVAVALSEG